jgi:mevalonate pyrophosphate decarboxylase
VNNAAMNLRMKTFIQYTDFISFGYTMVQNSYVGTTTTVAVLNCKIIWRQSSLEWIRVLIKEV